MKHTRLLSVFILLLLASLSFRASAARVFAPNSQRDMSAARTYCQGATATNVRFRYYTCNLGSGTTSGVSMTVNWYQNTVDATTGGTLVSSSTVACARTSSGSVVYIPSTATPGTSYYYCVITWTDPGTCNTDGAITSTTTRINVSETPGPIAGADNICIGTPETYTNSASGGTWSRSNTRVNIDAATGVATGVSSGAVRITYRVGCGTRVTKTVTVAAVPTVNVITGTAKVCEGLTRNLRCSPSGGTWMSTNTSIATVGTNGAVTGVATGESVITYRRTNACGTAYTTRTMTVAGTPAAISGPNTLCVGYQATFTDITPYGTWRSSSVSRATVVSTTGEVTGVSAGAVRITYNTGCSPVATKTITVSATSSTISGSRLICDAGTTTLTSSVAGGTWTSNNTAVATVDASGVVSAVSLGTAAISYHLSSSSCDAVAIVTVAATPAAISGPTAICSDATATMTNAIANGAWTIGDTLVATIADDGNVTPVGQGATTITYSTGCGTAATQAFSVYTQPADLTGTLSVCLGATTTLANATAGGAWSTEDASFATVNSSGVVTGAGEGTVNISYTNGVCFATSELTVNPLANAGTITGTLSVCEGDGTDLESTGDMGGTWSSSATSVATVSSSGVVNGITPGTARITYTATGVCGTASTSTVVTVNADPVVGTMSGATSVCQAATTTLSNSISGGAWTSSNASVATVGAAGVVTGVAGGNANITYTVANACGSTYTLQAMTVNPLPSAGTITGTATVCTSATTSLANAISGGAWSSGNTSVATVNSSGVVTGVASGTARISYGITNSCGTTYATQVVTVNTAPSVAGITGTSSLCISGNTTLSNATPGGAWSSSSSSVATVGTYGVVSGVAAGNATITYSVSNSCGTGTATTVVTVDGAPSVASITGSASMCGVTTTDLDNATAGGAWSSGNTAVATVGTDGVVAAVSPGTSTISYAVSGSCATGYATVVVTVGATPASITGSASVCMGGNSTLSVADAIGGTWSSSNTAIATINSSGVVSPVSPGTSNITYTSNSGCFTSNTVVTVSYTVAGITGTNYACEGFTSTLSNATTGGVWSSSNTSVATIDASTGFVNALVPGTVSISYTIAGGCFAPVNFYVYTMPLPITGANTICTEGYTSLSSTSGGSGLWTSSDSTVASISSTLGIMTGIGAGTATITYRIPMSGCQVTKTVTINQTPGNISGVTPMCASDVATFTNATSGGTWSSVNASVASIDATTGVVTAITGGGTTISYVASNGCARTFAATVNALPASILSSVYNVCLGVGMTMTSATSGGTWSSSNTAVATVGTNGVVTSMDYGTSTISYTVNGCSTKADVTVTAGVASIAGADVVCKNYSTTLTNATAGGRWNSSNTTVASINSTSGVLTGMTGGTTVVTYKILSNGCISRKTVTVGDIVGATRLCMGSTGTVTHAMPGGTWSCSNTARATINATTGEITPVSVGTAILTYMVTPTMYNTATVYVNALPVPITGPNTICREAMSTYTGTPGTSSTWTSSDVSVATIQFATGLATGIAEGTTTITYRNPTTGCYTTKDVTVIPIPSVIAGPATICAGESATLESSPTGGVWTASNTVASVNSSTGVVTGNIGGGVVIRYTAPNGCFRTKSMTVNATPSNITGSTTIAAGGATTLTCGTTGGTWSSSNTAVAIPATTASIAIGSTTSKMVNGVSGGTATISYTLSNGCSKTAAVTVVAGRPGRNVAENAQLANGFRMYPNPTSGMLTVEAETTGTFVLFTFDGKMVQEFKLEAAANSISLPSGLASGMYICQFMFEDGTSRTEKLMYQN